MTTADPLGFAVVMPLLSSGCISLLQAFFIAAEEKVELKG